MTRALLLLALLLSGCAERKPVPVQFIRVRYVQPSYWEPYVSLGPDPAKTFSGPSDTTEWVALACMDSTVGWRFVKVISDGGSLFVHGMPDKRLEADLPMTAILLAALSLQFTAPTFRNDCQTGWTGPTYGSIVYVQVYAWNWTTPSPWLYQQTRAVPGQRYTLNLKAVSGKYGVFCRTISERGYKNCSDTTITVQAP